MAKKARSAAPKVVIGISGGSGSGKSQLSQYLADSLREQSVVLCHDWYYKDNGHLHKKAARALNFDHPAALDTLLMCEHIDRLMKGESIQAPVYNYAAHSRLARTRTIEPRPLLILDGILILHEKSLRNRMMLSVFIDVPDDIRLLRRVRRDATQRRVKLDETLHLYENSVRPMHQLFVAPSAHHATWIWSQLDDVDFPEMLVDDLRRRMKARF